MEWFMGTEGMIRRMILTRTESMMYKEGVD